MSAWRVPTNKDVGEYCRVRFHTSKMWEAGWVITGIFSDTIIAKKAGVNYSSREFTFDNIQVRETL